jgi:hypothetical protein
MEAGCRAYHMKLKLPSVSLVMCETRAHELALLAVQSCVEKVDFAEVFIFTDRPLTFSPLTHVCNPTIITIDDFPSKLDWCRWMWFGVPKYVKTSHSLLIQWDSWIWDVDMWRDDFLDWDFIGACWWYETKNVGNTGFALKSSRLARYISANRDKYPCTKTIEDDLLCRTYRPMLEERGFMWAPERVAYDFAYEGCVALDGSGSKRAKEMLNKHERHFGFHGTFNFRHVLDYDGLRKRAELMIANPYIRENYMMRSFVETNIDLIREIAGDKYDKLAAAADAAE